MERKRVLMVEDNPDDAFIHTRLLKASEGMYGVAFDVERVESLSQAIERLTTQKLAVDVVLLDLGLPDGMGLASVNTLRSRFASVPVVVLSGNQNVAMAHEAVSVGAQDYLIKGDIRPDSLSRALSHAILRAEQAETVRRSEAEHRRLSCAEFRTGEASVAAPSWTGGAAPHRVYVRNGSGADTEPPVITLPSRTPYSVMCASVGPATRSCLQTRQPRPQLPV